MAEELTSHIAEAVTAAAAEATTTLAPELAHKQTKQVAKPSQDAEIIGKTDVVPSIESSAYSVIDAKENEERTPESKSSPEADSSELLPTSIESSYASVDGKQLQEEEDPSVVLVKTPTVKSIFWSCAINLFLPFVNGMMLGFGEIFAHELGFRWGWSAARVSFLFLFYLIAFL